MLRDAKSKKGSITGVGSAKAEGIGTIHWKLRTDSGKYIDVFIRNALYVPSMDLRIISVAQWGKQPTADRTDKRNNPTKIVTDPDKDQLTSAFLINMSMYFPLSVRSFQ